MSPIFGILLTTAQCLVLAHHQGVSADIEARTWRGPGGVLGCILYVNGVPALGQACDVALYQFD